MPKFISRGQIRKLSELHRGRPGGIMTELTAFATEHGVETGAVTDPMHLMDPLMALEDDRKQGLGPQMQEFIIRLTSGGLARSEDIRVLQSKVLWDLGFGSALDLGTFKQYLNGTDAVEPIPALPVWPASYPTYLDRDVLVDKRVLERVGLKEVCRLSGVTFPGNDNTFEAFEEGRTRFGIYWMRAQDGQRNRNKSPRLCRTDRFASCEVGLEEFGGLSLFVQDREVINGHVMDLPGSVYVASHDNCAYLRLWYDRPKLCWNWDDCAYPSCGSASCGE